MSIDEELVQAIWDRLADPRTVDLIRNALAQHVVLDTWMNGEQEEQVSAEAEGIIIRAAEELAGQALIGHAVLPHYPMQEGYVRAVFTETLSSMALFAAQKKNALRHVDSVLAREAVETLRQFVAQEPEGLAAVGLLFIVIFSHEDFNALDYYRKMRKDDFLLGHLHRPWSNAVLIDQLAMYRRAGMVEEFYSSEGSVLSLTQRGRMVLERLRQVLAESGELEWRSQNQRWVIFHETDYDTVFQRIFRNHREATLEYLDRLDIPVGCKILEVGAGTGRVTVDLGLADRVGPQGLVVGLDPSAALLKKMQAKCQERNLPNVQVVQGVAESLPFPDHTFDITIAVFSLHFTDAAKAVAEMIRVTKPGGRISAALPAPDFDLRDIPMVAMWFRPLNVMAERMGVPFGEKRGLPAGHVQELFRRLGLAEVDAQPLPGLFSAEDHRSFLAFFLKGGAFFQNIFSRLPYAERWGIMRLLEESGAEIAAHTSPAEKEHVFGGEAVYGRVPLDRS